MKEYANGYAFICYNLDGQSSKDMMVEQKYGQCRFELAFLQALAETVSLIVYAHFPALLKIDEGPRWQSGNTLASHLCGRGSIPVMAVSGKGGSCLPLVGSLQYTTLANSMYWFPLPFQLPVVI